MDIIASAKGGQKHVEVFCCYAREDQSLLRELKTHLIPLKREGLITLWADTDINAGAEWEKELHLHLNTSHIILLLVSPDFMASDYCYSTEMTEALKRHQSGQAQVIPLILRPVDWLNTPFAKLQALPRDARPVVNSKQVSHDEGFANIAKGIREAVVALLAKEEQRRRDEEAKQTRLAKEAERVRLAEEERRRKVEEAKQIRLDEEKRRREAGQIGGTSLSDKRGISQWHKGGSFKLVIGSLLILIVGSGLFTYWRLQPPQIPCSQRSANLRGCGSEPGISKIAVSGGEYTIGLNEDFQQQFDQTSRDEKEIEGLILLQNNEAEKGKHFTIILATTLSKSTSDQYTGLEELRGAFLAQQIYNKNHLIKMRLLVANLGVRTIAYISVPKVARQIALYAANAPQNDHFLGVTGFPFSLTLQYGLPILQKNQIPVVGSSPSDDQFSHSSGFHRVESPNSEQVKYLLTFIQNILHPQNVMILYDSSDTFSKNLSADLTTRLPEVPTSSYVGGDVSSLNQSIEAIVSNNPDLLIFTGFPADLNTLKTAMIQRGLHIPRILGSQTLYELGAYTSPKQGLPSNYANLMFSSFAFPDDPTPFVRAFQKAYADAFDSSRRFPGTYGKGRAGSHAALSYDAVLALQHAVDNLSGNGTLPSIAEVSNALNTLPYFTGATGNIQFSSGSSDPNPTTRPLDILCTNSKTYTQLLVKYYPNSVQIVSDLSVCN